VHPASGGLVTTLATQTLKTKVLINPSSVSKEHARNFFEITSVLQKLPDILFFYIFIFA